MDVCDIRTHLVPCSCGVEKTCLLRGVLVLSTNVRLTHSPLGVQWRAVAQRDHKPVIIMLTDSGDWHKDSSLQILRAIVAQEAALPEEQRLTLHMIGFGPDVDVRFVEQLADAGSGSHLVCQTGGDMDRLDLVKAFGQLAAQPALKVSLLHALRGGAAPAAAAAAAGGAGGCAAHISLPRDCCPFPCASAQQAVEAALHVGARLW